MEKVIGIIAAVIMIAAGTFFVSRQLRYRLMPTWQPSGSSSPAEHAVTVGNTTVRVEYARTFEEQRVGLMNRKNLDENAGMLFVFEAALPRSFWNQNTYISLDVIWIRKGVVVGIDSLPSIEKGLTIVSSPTSADQVLEVNKGFTKRHEIIIGAQVQ